MNLSRAARQWLRGGVEKTKGLTITVLDGGVIASRKTGVTHHMADAAEITLDGQSVIAGRWLCGGSSVDAVRLDDDEVACLNCRLAAALTQEPCVYYAWDENDDLLYVGSSINLPQRIRGHMSGTHWWPKVRRLSFDEHLTEFDARRAEAEAIAARPGVHNRDGVRREGSVSPLGFIVGGAS